MITYPSRSPYLRTPYGTLSHIWGCILYRSLLDSITLLAYTKDMTEREKIVKQMLESYKTWNEPIMAAAIAVVPILLDIRDALEQRNNDPR
jgi:hypothetical protein